MSTFYEAQTEEETCRKLQRQRFWVKEISQTIPVADRGEKTTERGYITQRNPPQTAVLYTPCHVNLLMAPKVDHIRKVEPAGGLGLSQGAEIKFKFKCIDEEN